MIDINWFVHESPGLKADWFGEIKYSNRLYILNAQRPFHKLEVEKLADNSLKYAYDFSCEQEPCLPFSIHWETFRV